jgi:branched-chain amino acid transport system ATP-binding protein
LDQPLAVNKLPMVTNRLNSNHPNRKSLQLQCLDATALLMEGPPPIFDPFVALSATGMTILLVERNAYAALAIADQAYVLETAGLV